MYRYAQLKVVAADDSSLDQKIFERQCVVTQTRDLETFSTTYRVAPGASETSVSIAPVTTGYVFHLFSDYPVKVRLNSSGGTQFTLTPNSVSATNAGAPLPDQCYFSVTAQVTEVRLEPISGAAQTASVRILVTGDPSSSYA